MYRTIGLVLFIGVVQNAIGKVHDQPITVDHKLLYCSYLYNKSISLESQKKYIVTHKVNDRFKIIVAENHPEYNYQGLNNPRYFWRDNQINKTSLIQSSLSKQMASLHCFEN